MSDQSRPRNHGLPWTDEQEEKLANDIKDGRTIDRIASDQGRSNRAIRLRIRKMIPDLLSEGISGERLMQLGEIPANTMRRQIIDLIFDDCLSSELYRKIDQMVCSAKQSFLRQQNSTSVDAQEIALAFDQWANQFDWNTIPNDERKEDSP